MSSDLQTDGASRKPVRKSIKAASGKSGQQQRREEALQRQQAARRDLGDHARRLAFLASEGPSRAGHETDQVL